MQQRNYVLEILHCNIKLKILHNKEAYLLSKRLKDMEAISDANGLNEIAIKDLISEYCYQLYFFSSGKYLLVHASDINPCEYGIAALHGCGLRDDDILRSFGRFIQVSFCKEHLT